MIELEDPADTLVGVPRPVHGGRAYYPALDGMRAVAFLLVFYFHYFFLPWGWIGVEIFFVLSGFLITGILYDTQDDPRRFRNFYLRRTLRIFPLYWTTLVVVFAVALLIHAKMGWSFAAWPLYTGNMLGLLHRAAPDSAYSMIAAGRFVSRAHSSLSVQIGHFWSLCVEEQFYILWPAVIFFVRRRSWLMWICGGFIVICPAARLIAHGYAPTWMLEHGLLYSFAPMRIDAFTYGGLLALMRRGERMPSLKRFAAIYLCLATTVLVLTLGPHPLDSLLHESYVYPSWEKTWGLVLADSLSLALLILALEPGSIVYRLFHWRGLRWLGRISYGAYVFHYIFLTDNAVLFNVLPVKHKLVPVQVFPLIVTVMLAWLSFRYLETPFIRLKDRFAS